MLGSYLSLEKTAVVEQLLHSHVRDDRTGFTFDDTLHDVLDVVASGGDCLRACCADLTVRVACEKNGILFERCGQAGHPPTVADERAAQHQLLRHVGQSGIMRSTHWVSNRLAWILSM